MEINVASCHSKFVVYEVINCRTIVRVHLGTYVENVNTRFKRYIVYDMGYIVNFVVGLRPISLNKILSFFHCHMA